MKTVTSSYARTHFYALTREANAGKSICITRHGKIVARLIPIKELK
jgi:prevent-host-death family protein